MDYKTINVKPETKIEFRRIGNRSQTDDEVLCDLINLHYSLEEDMGYKK